MVPARSTTTIAKPEGAGTGSGSVMPRCSNRSNASASATRLADCASSRSEVRTARTMIHDDNISARATTTVAATVIRTRTVPHNLDVRRMRLLGGVVSRRVSRCVDRRGVGDEAIARTAHREDRLQSERRVDLLAEVTDVDLDDVRIAGEVD